MKGSGGFNPSVPFLIKNIVELAKNNVCFLAVCQEK
jgi:hypothetical protein